MRTHNEIAPALAEARAYGHDVLAETYIELGREVRCGVIERDGELVGVRVVPRHKGIEQEQRDQHGPDRAQGSQPPSGIRRDYRPFPKRPTASSFS